jgi:hypothetical protein
VHRRLARDERPFLRQFRGLPADRGEFPGDDPPSPFSPPTETGYQKTFVLPQAGIFPYRSKDAWVVLLRMWGAVIVE